MSSIFANNLHKRLFKLTDNYGWLRKYAENEAHDNKADVVIDLPTIEEFIDYLAIEGDVETTGEEDGIQARLNHAVAYALIAFYKQHIDLSRTALTTWKFQDVSMALIKSLRFFDAEDLNAIKIMALDNSHDDKTKELVSDTHKLSDAIRYVLTRAYLHTYVVLVSKNPTIAVFNLMSSINDTNIPLSLTVGQRENGHIVLTAAKDKKKVKIEENEEGEQTKKVINFPIDDARGPRLSDWIKSLRISRAEVLSALQKEYEKKDPSGARTLKAQYLILSSTISHLENIATAWKSLALNDRYKVLRLDSVLVMDDPPIANLLREDPHMLDKLSSFLPSSIYDTYKVSSAALTVKKWDGTIFRSLSKKDSGEELVDVELFSKARSSFSELNNISSEVATSLPETPEFANIKPRLSKYNEQVKKMFDMVLQSYDSPDKETFSMLREIKDNVQSIFVILMDLERDFNYNVDSSKVKQLVDIINEGLPKLKQDGLSFKPSAAFIKQIYLPTVTTKTSFHTDMYKEMLKDMKHALAFAVNKIPSFTGEQGSPMAIGPMTTSMGLTVAQAQEMAKHIYREGFAKTSALINRIPDDKIELFGNDQINQLQSIYNTTLRDLKNELFTSLSPKFSRPISAEDFSKICDAIWWSIPKLSGKTPTTDLNSIIKNIRGSDIAARTSGKEKGTSVSKAPYIKSSQDFNDVYSKWFLGRERQSKDPTKWEERLGNGLEAAERLTHDFFYSSYDDHEKKHQAWSKLYSDLDDSSAAQVERKGLIKNHYEILEKTDALKKLGLEMPRGNQVVDQYNPINPEKDKDRQAYISNIQKFLKSNSNLDELEKKIDALGIDASVESVMIYIGAELVDAFYPELTLYLANQFPKTVIKGVSTGFEYGEKAEVEENLYGSVGVGAPVKYRDLIDANIPSIENARAFLEEFKREVRFNSRALGQLHPYTAGGMIADIYYMEHRKPRGFERLTEKEIEEFKKKREGDVARYKDPLNPMSILNYMKKRVHDSYGKFIDNRNRTQLNRMLIHTAKTRRPDAAQNLKAFMEKVGAFADPLESIRAPGSKANYKYIEGKGDTAALHMARAYSSVGQISASVENYDTLYAAYRLYFDGRREELLRMKDKTGKAIWTDYIIPYKVASHELTNRPFLNRLPELAAVAAMALIEDKKVENTTNESVSQESTDADEVQDTDVVSWVINDRKSAMNAISSIDSSIVSNLDKSFISGIVSNMGRKNPKIYSNGNVFLKQLIEEIKKESALYNRDEIVMYLESYVTVIMEQAQEVAPQIAQIVQEERSGNKYDDLVSLRLEADGLIKANVPTGLDNSQYLEHKVSMTIKFAETWLEDFKNLSIRYNLDNYIDMVNSMSSGATSRTPAQLKSEFDKLTPAQRKMYNVADFGAFIAYYRAYVESRSMIEAQETYPEFIEFLEMQDDYLQEYRQLAEMLQQYIADYKSVDLKLFDEAAAISKKKSEVEVVMTNFTQKLIEIKKVLAMDPSASASKKALEKWKSEMVEVIDRHKQEFASKELPITLPEKQVEEAEELEELSEEDVEEILPEESKESKEVEEVTTPGTADRFAGLKAIAKDLSDLATNKDTVAWLDQNAPNQKNEILGNMNNFADALSKLDETSFNDIDRLTAFEQSVGRGVSRVKVNLSELPQIFSDKFMKRLVGDVYINFGVKLSEMPLSTKQMPVVAPAPKPVELPAVKFNMEQFKSALQLLASKAVQVEGNINDMASSQDALEQLTGNTISPEQAAVIVSNTKTLLEYLNSLTDNDFSNQAGINDLTEKVIMTLVNRKDTDFIKLFSATEFPKLMTIIRSRFGITKQSSQKLSNTSSLSRTAVYNISTGDESDEGYYF